MKTEESFVRTMRLVPASFSGAGGWSATRKLCGGWHNILITLMTELLV
jgi:hypothetical protein